MENIQQQAPLKSNRGWPILLLAVLAGLITVVFPLALVIAPALWAYAGARTKPHWIALPAAAFGIAALQIYTTEAAAGLTLSAGIVAALKDVLGDQKGQQGDLVIPVYLGNQLLDEVIVTAQQRMSLRSGGR